jgi:DNA-binding NarL/FixJ family response regulator
VIVASDDPRVGPALVAYLASTNPAITTTGPVAYDDLTAAAVYTAHVIVCDLDETNVTAALRWVETLARELGIAVVALSSNPTVRRQALGCGAASAVDKSTDVDRLARDVAAAARQGHP